MDDQKRGGQPGAGPHPDVPLKRDRKLLRSSKPLGVQQRPAPELQHELKEPEPQVQELSPAEQLFAGQWSGSESAAPPEPAPVGRAQAAEHPVASGRDELHPIANVDLDLDDDIDLVDAVNVDRGVEAAPVSRPPVGAAPVAATPVAAAPAKTDEPAEVRAHQSVSPPLRPYVPPGGFSGPGHPRLGPLAPMPAPSHPGLRSLDIAALVTAVLVPPVGLIVAVVAIVRGKKLRGWASDLARAAISIALVMTVVFTGVGGYVWVTETEKAEQLAAVKAEQRAHDRVEAASEPFCGVLAANPTIYSSADPDYGWPAVDVEGGYLAAINQYSAVWAELATVAPPGIAEETAAISQRVTRVVDIANALGSSNRAGDLLGLHEQSDLATVESWYVEYCDAPETPVE